MEEFIPIKLEIKPNLIIKLGLINIDLINSKESL